MIDRGLSREARIVVVVVVMVVVVAPAAAAAAGAVERVFDVCSVILWLTHVFLFCVSVCCPNNHSNRHAGVNCLAGWIDLKRSMVEGDDLGRSRWPRVRTVVTM